MKTFFGKTSRLSRFGVAAMLIVLGTIGMGANSVDAAAIQAQLKGTSEGHIVIMGASDRYVGGFQIDTYHSLMPAFRAVRSTIRAFDPQPAPPAPLNRLSSASPDKAPDKAPSKGQNDPAQQFQQILQQLTQGQG